MKPELSPLASTRNGGRPEGFVDQEGDPPLRHRADLGERDGEQVGADRHRLGVEVAAGEHVAIVGEDQRIVGDRVGLDRRASSPRSASRRGSAPITCGWQRSE